MLELKESIKNELDQLVTKFPDAEKTVKKIMFVLDNVITQDEVEDYIKHEEEQFVRSSEEVRKAHEEEIKRYETKINRYIKIFGRLAEELNIEELYGIELNNQIDEQLDVVLPVLLDILNKGLDLEKIVKGIKSDPKVKEQWDKFLMYWRLSLQQDKQ